MRGNKAYVTLQENNALAIINIAGATVEKIVGLGPQGPFAGRATRSMRTIRTASTSATGRCTGCTARRDRCHPRRGRTYLIMANEGDAREYARYVEALRLDNAAYVLDPTVSPMPQRSSRTRRSAGYRIEGQRRSRRRR